ncbi:hypothetical protein F4824DRAFT_405365 [Ustulina deusta]|nr:hypothetical protein F4824DRAFT_405365 [Ustulina deusta]
MTTLPFLTGEPTRHPGCCLSLSQPLLATIRTLLRSIPVITPSTNPDEKGGGDEHASTPQSEPALLLSIGSGTGLLEELLHIYLNHDAHRPLGQGNSSPTSNDPDASGLAGTWRVEGVEVNQVVNLHLPEDRINHVAGTWAILESRVRDATALMFVYPRDGALVRRYIDAFMTYPPRAGDSRSRGGDQQQEGGRKHENVSVSMSKSQSEGENEVKRTSESVKKDENRDKSTTETWSTTGAGVQLVLWLGPKCDWEDTGLVSSNVSGEFEVFEMRHGVGLAEYEMLAALRRKTIASR